mgnify:CR=1 FL=1
MFDTHYKNEFINKDLLKDTNQELGHLISDAATMKIIRWTNGNFGMIAHNYDADMLTDEMSQVHKSPGFITSNLIGTTNDGKLIKQFSPSTKPSVIENALIEYAGAAAKVSKNHSSHVRTGMREGKAWKTEIPIEDRNTLQAMQRSNRTSGRGGPGGRRPGGN